MTKKELETALCTACPKAIADCTDKELYTALLAISQQAAAKKEENAGKKKLYYISAEFLIGKLLSNNLINLGLYDDVKAILEENGKSLAAVEEAEPEPSLGNGGLGRLAACFLDSIATLGLTITSAFLSSSLKIINRRRLPIPGLKTPPGLQKPM